VTVPGTGDRKIVARSFPTDDVVLAAHVQELLQSRRAHDPASVASELETRLRPVYPHIRTSVRSDVAGFGDTMVYVFRDGSAAHLPDVESWIEDPGTARVVSGPTGVYVDANEAAARLFGHPVESIIGNPAGTYTRPDVRIEDRDALWRMLDRTGRLHSLAVVRCADGGETPVEFMTVKDGDGPGRNVTYLRERH